MMDHNSGSERPNSAPNLKCDQEFESCLKIQGHSILPPFMTPERRAECRDWKQKAVRIEKMKVGGVEKTRPKSQGSNTPEQIGGSAISINTVIENPSFKCEPCYDSQDYSIEGPVQSSRRRRRGSYTLDEPSPLLLAYMERFGRNAPLVSPVSNSSISKHKPSSPENHRKNLENYLKDLSSVPNLQPPGSPDEVVNDNEDDLEIVDVKKEDVVLSKKIEELAETVRKDSEQVKNRVSSLIKTTNSSVSDDPQQSAITSVSPSLLESESINLPTSNSTVATPRPTVDTGNSTRSRATIDIIAHEMPMAINPLKPSTPEPVISTLVKQQEAANDLQLAPLESESNNFPQSNSSDATPKPTAVKGSHTTLINPTELVNPKSAISTLAKQQAFKGQGSSLVEATDSCIHDDSRRSIATSVSPSLLESESINLPTSISTDATPRPSAVTRNSTTSKTTIEKIADETPTPVNPLEPSAAFNLESVISTLAKQQQAAIDRLLAQQAKEREEMRKMFREQNEEMIKKIMGMLSNNLKVDPSEEETPSFAADLPPLPKWAERTAVRSPLIPTTPMHLRPESRVTPEVPQEALSEEKHKAFCKLSAMVKGHLTRKLMKSRKVQGIINAMRDSMTIALQLHQEAKSQRKEVSSQDIDLHRRLLQQLYKESLAFHQVFFKTTPAERMAILSTEREIEGQRSVGQPARLSAVTLARMEQKQQIQNMLQAVPNATNKPRRRSQRSSLPGTPYQMSKARRSTGSRRSLSISLSSSSPRSRVSSGKKIPRSRGKENVSVTTKPWK